MKNTIIAFFTVGAALFSGCHSKSYYGAQNVNQQRFDGQKQETAAYLTEMHNLVLLLENLSQLAVQKSESRETYLAAMDMEEKVKKIQLKIAMEATVHRIKLASALSEKNDLSYQKLKNTSGKEFDEKYVRLMLEKLEDLNDSVVNYQQKGHNDRIKKLSEDVEDMVAREIRSFQNPDLI